MREFMLIIHFIGLAMGLGTSIGFIFLGKAMAKLPAEERIKTARTNTALSKMGQTGLILLILSGGYLMTPYWEALGQMPLMIAKLGLVVVLTVLVITMNSKVSKMNDENAGQVLQKLAPLGKLGLVTAITIVVLAVLVFH